MLLLVLLWSAWCSTVFPLFTFNIVVRLVNITDWLHCDWYCADNDSEFHPLQWFDGKTVWLRNEGRMELEIDRQRGEVSAVKQVFYWTAVVKRKLSLTAKLLDLPDNLHSDSNISSSSCSWALGRFVGRGSGWMVGKQSVESWHQTPGYTFWVLSVVWSTYQIVLCKR